MLSKFDRSFTWANQFVVGSLMLAMAILVFANVVLRYLFGTSLPWVEEITRYMMIWVAWLAVGLAMREGAHIAIDNFQNALPPLWAQWLRFSVFLMMLGFFAIVAWFGLKYSLFAWKQESAVLRLSLGAIYLAIPVGSLLMLVHTLLMSRRLITHQTNAEDQAKAAEFSVV
ncbi:TRAP transporter small permease [Rhizobium sp. TH135]|uniref:TRAP transporter small permease n=1 Tax=Rhizobium sp. TH135 TaxID=2067451 RepID=UPI001AECDCDD|nr:TRAP transporter small permease [Rhizobium sp. TH135]